MANHQHNNPFEPVARPAAPAPAPAAPTKTVRDAAARAAEVRAMRGPVTYFHDDFYMPPPPEGWSHEWKAESVIGKEDPYYMSDLLRQGWEPVQAERYPNYVPRGSTGAIRKKGLVLMERPKELTDESNAASRKEARDALANRERAFFESSGPFERTNINNRSRPVTVEVGPSSPIPGD